jgi:3-dehydroquinate synthase
LPVRGPALEVGHYIELMRHDKKVEAGRLRLVLLQSVGRAVVSDVASEPQIAAAIAGRLANA